MPEVTFEEFQQCRDDCIKGGWSPFDEELDYHAVWCVLVDKWYEATREMTYVEFSADEKSPEYPKVDHAKQVLAEIVEDRNF